MTRILKVDKAGPYRVKAEDLEKGEVWICGCGLSANKPFCDSSHKTARTEAAGVVYYYPDNTDENPRKEIDPALAAHLDEGTA